MKFHMLLVESDMQQAQENLLLGLAVSFIFDSEAIIQCTAWMTHATSVSSLFIQRDVINDI